LGNVLAKIGSLKLSKTGIMPKDKRKPFSTYKIYCSFLPFND
jgi:hypothetical protein